MATPPLETKRYQLYTSATQFLKRKATELSYTILGPTLVHLQFEFYLLITQVLFAASSLQSVYYNDPSSSIITRGDCTFLALVALWLSRHLLFRWTCTWDPSTHSRPTVRGVLSRELTSNFYNKQVSDQPKPSDMQQLTGATTTSSSTTTTSTTNKSVTLAQLLPCSVLYTAHMIQVRVWFPLTRMIPAMDGVIQGLETLLVGPIYVRTTTIRTAAHGIIQKCCVAWLTHAPTLSFLIPALVLVYYVMTIVLLYTTTPLDKTVGIQMNAIAPTVLEEEKYAAYGAYVKVTRPKWSDVFVYEISALATVMTLLVFFRLVLPIPDQIAGGNVIKDLRNEARSVSNSGKSSKSSGRSWKDSPDTVWTSRSIANCNRFRLTFQVGLIRLIEFIAICGILPRTDYICRATEHCPEGTQLYELTRILYPAGISSPLRKDSQSAPASAHGSYAFAFWTIISITVVSTTLQLAHTITVNKSYLAIMAYVSSEWDPVQQSADLFTRPSAWDSRKRYKKGDYILFPPTGKHQTVYRATVNAPEGKPSDPLLRVQHDLFLKEFGHPATSDLLCKALLLQSAFALLHVVLVLVAYLSGFETGALTTMMVAHLVAAYALATVGVPSYRELDQLNNEIAGVTPS
jgi:hypothetical protein